MLIKKVRRYVFLLLMVMVSGYSLLSLMVIFAFTFLNQSSNTPKEDQLGFFNYVVPFLLTVGFILYFNIYQFLPKSGKKDNWIFLMFLLVAGLIALNWQVKAIQWYFSHGQVFDSIDFSNYSPFLVSACFTIGTIVFHFWKCYKK